MRTCEGPAWYSLCEATTADTSEIICGTAVVWHSASVVPSLGVAFGVCRSFLRLAFDVYRSFLRLAFDVYRSFLRLAFGVYRSFLRLAFGVCRSFLRKPPRNPASTSNPSITKAFRGTQPTATPPNDNPAKLIIPTPCRKNLDKNASPIGHKSRTHCDGTRGRWSFSGSSSLRG